jgi:hypothetical protein
MIHTFLQEQQEEKDQKIVYYEIDSLTSSSTLSKQESTSKHRQKTVIPNRTKTSF